MTEKIDKLSLWTTKNKKFNCFIVTEDWKEKENIKN